MNPQQPYQPPTDPGQQPEATSVPPLPTSSPTYQPQAQPQVSFEQPTPAYQQPSPAPQPTPSSYGPVPEPAGIDYLNTIAPQTQKTSSRFVIIALIGGVLAALLFVVMIIAQSGGPNSASLTPAISARVQTLQKVAANQQSHLTENEIAEANASITSSLSTMDTDMQAIMKANALKKLSDKTAVAKEKAYLDSLQKKLDDAYQKGVLDRTYTTQMSYELAILKSQLLKLKKTSKNQAIKEFCTSNINNIDITLKTYHEFQASKS